MSKQAKKEEKLTLPSMPEKEQLVKHDVQRHINCLNHLIIDGSLSEVQTVLMKDIKFIMEEMQKALPEKLEEEDKAGD